MSVDHYTYRVTWSQEDGEYLGLCAELPSLSWLAATPEAALSGIRQIAAEAVADMRSNGELDGRLPLVRFLQGLGPDGIEIEREKDTGRELSISAGTIRRTFGDRR